MYIYISSCRTSKGQRVEGTAGGVPASALKWIYIYIYIYIYTEETSVKNSILTRVVSKRIPIETIQSQDALFPPNGSQLRQSTSWNRSTISETAHF